MIVCVRRKTVKFIVVSDLQNFGINKVVVAVKSISNRGREGRIFHKSSVIDIVSLKLILIFTLIEHKKLQLC